jgi:hypothetical protein
MYVIERVEDEWTKPSMHKIEIVNIVSDCFSDFFKYFHKQTDETGW